MNRPLAAAVLSLFALSPAAAQEDEADDAAPPPYRWLELGVGGQRLVDAAGDSQRADTAFRLATSVEVARHFYLAGAYTSARYESQTISVLGAGIGAHAPLAPGLHGIVQLTLESFDGDTVTQNGYGAEAGVRWFARAAEVALTAEYSRVEADSGQFSGAEDRLAGINLAAIVPVSDGVSLAFRIERLSGVDGDLNEDLDFDTFLVGLRLRPP
jgi:hypothetical protein